MTNNINLQGVLKAHELINLIMKRKNISMVDIEKKTDISWANIQKFLSNASNGNPYALKNPPLSRTEVILKACDEKLLIIDSEGKEFIPGNDIVTIMKLENKLGTFYFRTSYGDFQIITKN